MKTVILALGVLATTTAWAGNGLVGSGGDGLIKTNPNLGNVVVPVPQSMSPKYIVVEGKPGKGQNDTVYVEPVLIDPNGNLIHYGGTMPSYFKLNEKISVDEGLYYVWYSQTTAFVEVGSNDDIVHVKLGTISVPRVNGEFKFEVFADLTDPSMQDTILKDIWINKGNESNDKEFCALARIDLDAAAACKAIAGSDYRAESGTILKFLDDGEYAVLGIIEDATPAHMPLTHWTSGQFLMITDPNDGDSVSVLPGTYGIRFIAQDKTTKDVLGIHVD